MPIKLLQLIYTAGYSLAWLASWLVAVGDSSLEIGIIASGLYALVAFWLSYYEQIPKISVLSPFLMWVAIYNWLALGGLAGDQVSQTCVSAVMVMCLSYACAVILQKDVTRNNIFVAWTIFLGVLSWLLAFGEVLLPDWFGPVVLAFAALIGLIEARSRLADPSLHIVPFAAWLFAGIQLFEAYGPDINWLFYACAWSLYAGIAGYWLAIRQHREAASLVGLASVAIAVPTVVQLLAEPLWPNGDLQQRLAALALAVTAICHVWLRLKAVNYSAVIKPYFMAYLLSFVAAWLFIMFKEDVFAIRLLACLALLLVLVWSSYYERAERLFIAVPMLVFTATWQIASQLVPDYAAVEKFILAGLAAALISYSVSVTVRADAMRNKILLFWAIGLAGVVWLVAMDSSNHSLPLFVSPLALGFAAGVMLTEAARLELSALARMIPVAMLNIAFQQLVYSYASSTNWLVYTHLWALYLVYVVSILKKQGLHDTARTVKFSALTVFTLPTAYEALQDPAMYGYLLLAEHVALVILGALVKRRYMVYWGTVVSVLAVMYMLRSFAFVQLGITAVALIGYAIYRLQSEKHD